MFFKLIRIATLIPLLAFTSLSQAALIDGAILFSSFTWDKDGTTVFVTGPSIVASTFDLTGQTGVVISDMDYLPFLALKYWESDDYSFYVTSLSLISETATGLELEGFGILTDKNVVLQATIASWQFSGGTINWSMNTVTTGRAAERIPEPSSLAIFALGILGLVAHRFKKKA